MKKMLSKYGLAVLLFILAFFLLSGCSNPDPYTADNGARVAQEFDFNYPSTLLDASCENITLSPDTRYSEVTKRLVDSSVEGLKPLVEHLFSQNHVATKPEKMKLILRFVQTQIGTQFKFFDEGITLKCPLNTVKSRAGIKAERISLFASMVKAAGFKPLIVTAYSKDESEKRSFVGVAFNEKELKQLKEYFYFLHNGKKYVVFLPNSISCDFSCHPGQLFVTGIGKDGHQLLLENKTLVIEV